jgi:hypothetical protein
MFSSADLSLAAGKMRENELVTGSVKIAALGSLKRVLEGFSKLVGNFKGAS